MFILQFCNNFTHEIFKQETFKKTEMIENIIQSFHIDSGSVSFIVDNQSRLLKAEYVKHEVCYERIDILYKLFFNVQMVEDKIIR